LTPLEDRTLPAAGLNVSVTAGVLRVTDWQPGDAVTLRQTATGVAVDAAGAHQEFAGVGRVCVDVQSGARVTNDISALGGAAARLVYLARRDPTGRMFASVGALAPGATSGPATGQPPPTTPDWFDAALTDPGVRSLARKLAADGTLDRSDMLQIFTEIESDGTVVAAEFNDLKQLVHPNWSLGGGSGAPKYTMPDAVQVLASDVVDGDPANRSFQGAPLGNLQAGSSAGQLDKLVRKWFLGQDHPAIAADQTYSPASGSLFGSGPLFADARQGRVGDCYFLAALAELAQDRPQAIRDMFTDNGDGTYTVRFYHNGATAYVTVDRMLPTDAAGQLVYASFSRSAGDPGNKLWVALAERAYAQLNESGWTEQDGTNTYAGIANGYSDTVLQQVTNISASFTGIIRSSADQLAAAAANGLPTVLNSLTSSPGNGVTASHTYPLIGYSAATQKFTLYDPQLQSTIQLTWNQIVQSFSGYWQLNQ
jgi:hypothetical protein